METCISPTLNVQRHNPVPGLFGVVIDAPAHQEVEGGIGMMMMCSSPLSRSAGLRSRDGGPDAAG